MGGCINTNKNCEIFWMIFENRDCEEIASFSQEYYGTMQETYIKKNVKVININTNRNCTLKNLILATVNNIY